MVLTDKQRADLHASIHEYLLCPPTSTGSIDLSSVASALAAADPSVLSNSRPSVKSSSIVGSTSTLLEKKWTAVSRLQKRVLDLERQLASAVRHGFQPGDPASSSGTTNRRRLLPRAGGFSSLSGHAGPISSISLHPSRPLAASAGEDGTVKLWDHEGEGAYVRTFKGHTGPVNSVSFSPDGTMLVSCSSDLSVKLWDLREGRCVRTLRGHDHTISDVCFVPSPPPPAAEEGKAEAYPVTPPGAATLVTASRDQTVKFWEVETGYCIHTVSGRHSDWVRCLAAKNDGSLVASGGNDHVVHVFKAGGSDQGEPVAELRGHEHVVESVAFPTGPTGADVASDPARWRR